MRANGNETEAKLLCRVQIDRQEDVSNVATNFEAIFGPYAEEMLPFSSCVKNLLF